MNECAANLHLKKLLKGVLTIKRKWSQMESGKEERNSTGNGKNVGKQMNTDRKYMTIVVQM